MKTNRNQLVELAALGEIAPPTLRQSYRIAPVTGEPIILPSVGGIAYNANIGDPAVGIAADHIEPGVSIKHPNDNANRALNTFACIGNAVTVVSGDGKGKTGYVVGKHGGVEHVMVYFPDPQDLNSLVIGDKMQVRTHGQGLKALDYPDLTILSLDPIVFEKLCTETEGKVVAPVTHIIPAHLLGAGLGEDTCYSGDVDIQLFDEEAVAQYNLNTLRFGDIVAMLDTDHRYGRIYRKDWLSIGVVTHSCSVQAGHGPGVTTVLTGPLSILEYKLDQEANLKHYLGS